MYQQRIKQQEPEDQKNNYKLSASLFKLQFSFIKKMWTCKNQICALIFLKNEQ